MYKSYFFCCFTLKVIKFRLFAERKGSLFVKSLERCRFLENYGVGRPVTYIRGRFSRSYLIVTVKRIQTHPHPEKQAPVEITLY